MSAFICAAALPLAACGKEDIRISAIYGSTLENGSVVRWIGRTEYSADDEVRYTYYAATGFTVKFTGSELYVTYSATNTASDISRPYFVVMTDGQTAAEGTSFCLTKDRQTVKVAENLGGGEHTVTVLKRSEPENSLTAVVEICTDGRFLQPDGHSGYKFQILGGSGITGHGCLGTSGEEWTTENSSPFSAFGYLAAEAFGAECQFVSASGMGLKWGYRGVAALTEAYEATGLVAEYNGDGSTKSVSPTPSEWDDKSWKPDAVIANIGGNDWNSHISGLGGEARAEAEEQFKDAVSALLTRIHSLYPQAAVVWTVNSKSSGNGKLAYEAIRTLDFNGRIAVVEIDNSKNGADNHADAATHSANAQRVEAALRTLGLE